MQPGLLSGLYKGRRGPKVLRSYIRGEDRSLKVLVKEEAEVLHKEGIVLKVLCKYDLQRGGRFCPPKLTLTRTIPLRLKSWEQSKLEEVANGKCYV